jgi:hypothetical protein
MKLLVIISMDFDITEQLIDSKGFLRWCMTHRITCFLDFSHHLEF